MAERTADASDYVAPAHGTNPAALSSQAEVSTSSGDSVDAPAAGALTEGNFVAGGVRTFEWRWPGENGQENADFEPATYYEALTGKRDPQRNFFITARRLINIGVWVIALGLPIGLIALAVATGQSLETVFWVGIGASIVGMMFRVSFPRTPFD